MGANARIETLNDIASRRLNLAARCGRCGHTGVLDGAKVCRYFMYQLWDRDFGQVPRRLRCSKCRSRADAITVSFAAPDNPTWMADEESWKRLHRRLRG